jgi:hypothetical protein
VTTHNEAVTAYRQFQARQDGVADPPPAAGRPALDPAHAAALEHAAKLLTPSYRLEQQRAAEVEAERPPPRDTLRQAHQERTVARDEVDRLRGAVDRARHHLTEVTEIRDAAKQLVEEDAAANAAQLIA